MLGEYTPYLRMGDILSSAHSLKGWPIRRERMKIIIPTCAKYRFLMDDMLKALHKHWPRKPDVAVVDMGDAPADKWTDCMADYFKGFEDKYFYLLLDDYYLTDDVDGEWLDLAEGTIHKNGYSKVDLSDDRAKFPHVNHGIWILSRQWARYRSSLQAAIWSTCYFRKMLVRGRTPWQFELLGEKTAFWDGADIIGTTHGIVKYENIMLKGRRKE